MTPVAPSLPHPIYTYTEDGMIEIRLGDIIGTVSSDHLKQPKLHQLQVAWLRKHHSHELP
jgi:hypothetical protein